MTRQWRIIAFIGAVFAAMLTAPIPSVAAPALLSWSDCQDGFQCATASVPLDYAKPSGKKIELAVIKLPASGPEKRGSLFVNFGGPGGNGVDNMRARAKTVFSDEIRAHFDLVGFDPRGIGRSTAVRCFATEAEKDDFFGAIPDFPVGTEQEKTFFASATELGRRCDERNAELLDHMSTANAARDLDQLRAGVGEEQLNFVGYSYGTVMGATYANLFPKRVRAIILDGTLDFVGNATGHGGEGSKLPVDVRQGVADAGQETMVRFFQLCQQAGDACAFSAGGNLLEKWNTLLDRVREKPIVHPDGTTYSYSGLVGTAYYSLFKTTSYESLGSVLQELYIASESDTESTNRLAAPIGDEPYLNNRSEAYNAVQCIDSDEPTKNSVYTKLGVSEDERIRGFGRLATFDMMPCASWPARDSDRYSGPWNGKFAKNLLVINSKHDPATPLDGAKQAVKQLGKAQLLTVDAPGHTTMYSPPSACVEQARLAYLMNGKLPADGASCAPDQLPWGITP